VGLVQRWHVQRAGCRDMPARQTSTARLKKLARFAGMTQGSDCLKVDRKC
jgi:hypothetical protein